MKRSGRDRWNFAPTEPGADDLEAAIRALGFIPLAEGEVPSVPVIIDRSQDRLMERAMALGLACSPEIRALVQASREAVAREAAMSAADEREAEGQTNLWGS